MTFKVHLFQVRETFFLYRTQKVIRFQLKKFIVIQKRHYNDLNSLWHFVIFPQNKFFVMPSGSETLNFLSS